MPTKTATVPSHLWLDERGRPWIDDKNVKVIEVIEALMAKDWSVKQYQEDYSNYLTLAQVHAALTYYYDHQAEMDAEIERQRQEDETAWQAQGTDTALHRRLRAAGLIP
jgi:uncharacterized protein (DUF433 family)